MAPQIHEYTADANVAGPYDTRQARDLDTGNSGKALATLGDALSNVGEQMHKRDAQTEISKLNTQISAAHADFSTSLDQTLMTADPTDRTISDKFMEGYDDKMGEIGDGISTPEGQAYFEKMNAHMRNQFQIQSMKGQALLAGNAAIQNHAQMLDNFSTSLQNDPSSFDSVQAMHEQALEKLSESGDIPQNKVNELRAQGEEQLAKSAVRGWISIDPEGALKQLNGGQWNEYVSGDLKHQLVKESEQGINAKRIEENRLQRMQDDALSQKQQAIQDKFLAKLYGDEGLSTEEVIKSDLPPFGVGSKDQFLKMVHTAATEKVKTDANAYISLFNRIHLPDEDPQKITNENQLNSYFGHGLDMSALNQLRAEVQGKRTANGQLETTLKNNFVNTVKGQLTKANPMLGIKDPQGDAQYQAFLSQFLPAFDAAKKQGKDPIKLLTPGAPEYMGDMVKPFQRSPEEIMKSLASPYSENAPRSSATSGAAAPSAIKEPRKPGESPADYLKRTGG